ncbi:MAG: hypothetical protein ABIT83_00990 [Massilia sp.]
MAHNWTHSFMSGLNCVDGEMVAEYIFALARARRGGKVSINWMLAECDDEEFGAPVRDRIAAYRASLGEHLKRHEIDLAALIEFRTEVYVAETGRMYVRALVIDDREREHIAFVWS